MAIKELRVASVTCQGHSIHHTRYVVVPHKMCDCYYCWIVYSHLFSARVELTSKNDNNVTGIAGDEKISTTSLAVLTHCRSVRRTDGQLCGYIGLLSLVTMRRHRLCYGLARWKCAESLLSIKISGKYSIDKQLGWHSTIKQYSVVPGS